MEKGTIKAKGAMKMFKPRIYPDEITKAFLDVTGTTATASEFDAIESALYMIRTEANNNAEFKALYKLLESVAKETEMLSPTR